MYSFAWRDIVFNYEISYLEFVLHHKHLQSVSPQHHTWVRKNKYHIPDSSIEEEEEEDYLPHTPT